MDISDIAIGFTIILIIAVILFYVWSYKKDKYNTDKRLIYKVTLIFLVLAYSVSIICYFVSIYI